MTHAEMLFNHSNSMFIMWVVSAESVTLFMGFLLSLFRKVSELYIMSEAIKDGVEQLFSITPFTSPNDDPLISVAAFSQMGYNLSMNFVNMIVYRFDIQARRQLTLDNFIQACVMLKSLTDAFKQRDTAMSGTINLSYEDFMSLAVLNKP